MTKVKNDYAEGVQITTLDTLGTYNFSSLFKKMAMMNNRKKILILGIGNILLGDEGIGVHVIEHLRQITLPDEVELADGGTAGADIIDIIADREKVIIVDSMQTDDRPGTIKKFSIGDFYPSDKTSLSLHNLGIVETIFMTKMLGCAPREVTIFGIKPEKIHGCLELTEKLSQQVPKIIELILSEICGSPAESGYFRGR